MHHFVHQTGREEASTFWGACGAIRRSVFCELGGFDEHYTKASIEDIELGYRLRGAGHAIRLDKSLQVKHWKRWDARSMLRADFFQRALPWTQLVHRYNGFVNDLNTGSSARISVAAAFLLMGTLIGSLWEPRLLVLAAVSAGLLLTLNFTLYRFFLRHRGLWFMARAVFWHWLYFLYSGAAFGIGTLHYVAREDHGPGSRGSLLPSPLSQPGSRVEKRE